MQLYLTSCPDEVYAEVLRLHDAMSAPRPERPERSLTIMAPGPVLVGWVGLYECGAFLLAESFILNHLVPVRSRHQAGVLLVESFVAMAASSGKYAIAAPRSSGLAGLLRKYGFRNTGSPMYTASFPALPLTAQKKAAVPERGIPDDRPDRDCRAAEVSPVAQCYPQPTTNVAEPTKTRKRASARRSHGAKPKTVPGPREDA